MTSANSGCAMCSGCDIAGVVVDSDFFLGDCGVMLFLCNAWLMGKGVISDGVGFNIFYMSSKKLS